MFERSKAAPGDPRSALHLRIAVPTVRIGSFGTTPEVGRPGESTNDTMRQSEGRQSAPTRTARRTSSRAAFSAALTRAQ